MKGWGLRMNRPPKTKLSMALGGILLAASALVSYTAQATGLGKLSVNSALGQPLSAEIELVSLQPGEFEALSARVASVEAYTDARVEYSPLLRQLKFSVERRADGKPILTITSFAPINEPFLDVLVEVNWPGNRFSREYPILLDPPGFNEARVLAPAITTAPVVSTRPVAEPVTEPAMPTAATTDGSPSAKTEAATDAYGPVKRGDNLSKIASSVKPEGVSLEQMLVALYRENKAAFINNNMNQLKTGQILRVPTAAEVGKIAKSEAQKEIQVQVADWKSYREQIGGVVANSPISSAGKTVSNESTGKIAAVKPAQPTPAASSTDQLKIAKTEISAGKTGGATGAAGGGKNATQDQLNAMKEDAIAKDNKLKEANSRVSDLEKQIADMRQLIAMKGVATAAKPADAKPSPVAPIPAPVSTPAVASGANPTVAPKTDAPKVDVAAAKPAEAPKATVTPAPAKTPVKSATPPTPEPNFIEENAVALGAGTAGVLGVGGLLAFMLRRRKKSGGGNTSQLANTSSIMPSDLKPNSSTGNRGGGLVDTGNSSFLTDFDKAGADSMDSDEVDPVAEAEVYIAYGRDAQAEEILKEAMTRDKSRHEIAFKLLEIYHTRKSVQAFETVARELKESAGADHPLWAKAAALGVSIDPGNSLYGGTGQAFAPTGGYVADGAALAGAAEHAAPPDLDFDLGFGDTPGGSTTDAAADMDALKSGGQAASSMDFDLSLDSSTGEGVKPSEQSAGVDFDLASESAAITPAPAAATAAPAAESSGFDFDLSALSLDDPADDTKVHAASSPAQIADSVAADSGLSLSDLSLDLASPSDAGGSAGDASHGGTNAATTKLELAKAYIEIGDQDGAKEILAEVAREGNPAQQEEAKKILAGI